MRKFRIETQRVKRILMARHIRLVRIVLAGVVLIAFSLLVFFIFKAFQATSLGTFASMAKSFLLKPISTLDEHQGRTNILLLGKAQDGANNPVLTDTVILVSISQETVSGITMVSIPRDIWVPELSDKINSAYDKGNKKSVGGGLILAKSVAEKVVGVPIHYAVALDFDGFVEVVDILGGVSIEVERSFTDKKFPIAGRENDDCGGDPEFLCRYETLEFTEGLQVMDGGTALKFARSRHSENPDEGNDLARAKRQQKVIVAIKNSIFSSGTLYSPTKLKALWSTFWKSTETDLSRPQVALIGRLILDCKDKVSSYIVPEEMLENPPYSPMYKNLYVFLPKNGDWSEVHDWVRGALSMPK